MRTMNAPRDADAILGDCVASGPGLGQRRSPWIGGPAAVDAALACNAVTLRCGRHTLDFEKRSTALHDVELRLSHRKDCACEGGNDAPGQTAGEARSIVRLIPAVPRLLDDAMRAGIEKERLLAAGRALFAHVAHLIVNAENQPRGRRALRLTALAGACSRRAEVHGRGRICERSGCGTVLSVYNPSCFCALHTGVVDP
jgi:hypothetical protein